jgi:hypothetical protein
LWMLSSSNSLVSSKKSFFWTRKNMYFYWFCLTGKVLFFCRARVGSGSKVLFFYRARVPIQSFNFLSDPARIRIQIFIFYRVRVPIQSFIFLSTRVASGFKVSFPFGPELKCWRAVGPTRLGIRYSFKVFFFESKNTRTCSSLRLRIIYCHKE